jgi:hypothetical protein
MVSKADLLHRYGNLGAILAAGRFPTQAEALRLYRSIATTNAFRAHPRSLGPDVDVV